MRDERAIFLQHSVEALRNSMQPAEGCTRCTGRAEWHARSFGWILGGALCAVESRPSAGRPGNHWARCDGRLPARLERRHNPSIPNKNSTHARDVFHPHPDRGEMLLERPCLPTPSVWHYGHNQGSKERHEHERVCNKRAKMMDHARRLGLTDWQHPANLPWDRYKLLLEEDCSRECRDRTPRHRSSEHVRWHSFQLARVSP